MANTNVTNQYYLSGGKRLDAKLQPVDNVDGLKAITRKDRYIGMTVTVLNSVYDENGKLVSTNPIDYWLVDGTSNSCWKVKSSNTTVPSYADLMNLTVAEVYVGMERIVLSDETSENQMTEYWVSAIDTELQTITWEKRDFAVTITGEDVEN